MPEMDIFTAMAANEKFKEKFLRFLEQDTVSCEALKQQLVKNFKM